MSRWPRVLPALFLSACACVSNLLCSSLSFTLCVPVPSDPGFVLGAASSTLGCVVDRFFCLGGSFLGPPHIYVFLFVAVFSCVCLLLRLGVLGVVVHLLLGMLCVLLSVHTASFFYTALLNPTASARGSYFFALFLGGPPGACHCFLLSCRGGSPSRSLPLGSFALPLGALPPRSLPPVSCPTFGYARAPIAGFFCLVLWGLHPQRRLAVRGSTY